MKLFRFGTNLLCCGLFALLSACASTGNADGNAPQQKVASANCQTVEAKTGSNLSHRVCTPSPAASSDQAPSAQ